MNINSILKKEGIKVLGKLNILEVNKIAAQISDKISDAFPEHHINQSELFVSIARLNMYIAEMPNDMAMAKYFYKNNSIYFSKDIDLNDLHTLAIHECLHFMQEVKNNNGKLLRLGIYSVQKNTGMALNEAAVQHMASIATHAVLDSVKYYNMELSTESPDFYPIQTSLLNEMMFFTGTYPLYHSTLYSDDIFKNTFIAKSSLKTFNKIEKNFDLIFEYESLLSKNIYKLSTASESINNISGVRKLHSKIEALKDIIQEKTLETQNLIIYNCFTNSFNLLRDIDDINELREELDKFRELVISTEDYHFYDQFYEDMNKKLDDKEIFIQKYGNILTTDSVTNELSTIQENTFGFRFFKQLFTKLKLLFEEVIREKEF